MATIVIMPKQGQSVESCIITSFNKKKGESVKQGEVLFGYETDKASFEETAPIDGTILELFFGEGDEVPVLTNVLVIGQPGESIEEFLHADAAPESIQTTEVSQPIIPEAKTESPAVKTLSSLSGAVSPRAKKLAEKAVITTSEIKGTGPKGRIIERDIQDTISSRPKMTPLAKAETKVTGSVATEGSGLYGAITAKDLSTSNPVYGNDCEIKPITNMRKIIAKAMHASLQNSAQLTHHLGADARRILELREQVKKAIEKGYPTNVTLNDMVGMAVIKALKKFPQVNTHFLGDSIKYFNKVHLALAVDTDRGLMVPVVKNADDLSIQGLSNQFKEIANACRKGSIDPDLLSSEAATFTISNLGNYGVEIFTPVINLPQTAILGVNTIIPRPKDLGNGVYAFVPYIGLSLTYDHRALDGGEATRFLKQIAIEIENLEFEL
ncbi:dihydrolipoamide acetyltransferase family protein [Microbacter margulisiae]|uniref:Dihydrolipoamide acetyltransferase component of pyruvate dehydrogenase complex n=1 Tax=Microbacter margulisiae TaxID=1350067 RepID=A0A7W5DQ30_9PORP|nr:dihydrolipoamide acetyltransferase family protein [Microbacter margulisiae]MBB3186941.1 pyruvate dehydrogenase E2 component (dihydrolipoamide acetyltransferase) [Microbacter margulisiae]